MTSLTVSDLVSRLDPARDYGDRTYEQVVQDVHAGNLVLSPGAGQQPLIQEVGSGIFVKGTGRRAGSQEFKYNQQEVSKLLSGYLPEVLPAFVEDLMEKRDPRMFKIYFERLMGNAGQAFNGASADEVLEMMAKISGMSRSVPVDVESRPVNP